MPIETRFKCSHYDEDYIIVNSYKDSKIVNVKITNNTERGIESFDVMLDIPTAIKLSKTIRTHINKVKGI